MPNIPMWTMWRKCFLVRVTSHNNMVEICYKQYVFRYQKYPLVNGAQVKNSDKHMLDMWSLSYPHHWFMCWNACQEGRLRQHRITVLNSSAKVWQENVYSMTEEFCLPKLLVANANNSNRSQLPNFLGLAQFWQGWFQHKPNNSDLLVAVASKL